MVPVSIYIYDLFLIQGAERDNVRKNLKFAFIPFALVIILANLYLNLSTILKRLPDPSLYSGREIINGTESHNLLYQPSPLSDQFPVHSPP